MSSQRIPFGLIRNLPGLRRIPQLSEEQFEELLAVLANTPPAYPTAAFVDRVISNTSLDASLVRLIINSLGPLYITRMDRDQPIPEFVKALARSMEREERDDERKTDYQTDLFKDRLSRLLRLDLTLKIVAKANHLLFAQERSFLAAEIVTDLRPVFGGELDDQPLATLIVHSLKITYYDKGAEDDVFISLDASDIDRLRTVLNRAELKARKLKSVVESTALMMLGEEPNADA